MVGAVYVTKRVSVIFCILAINNFSNNFREDFYILWLFFPFLILNAISIYSCTILSKSYQSLYYAGWPWFLIYFEIYLTEMRVNPFFSLSVCKMSSNQQAFTITYLNDIRDWLNTFVPRNTITRSIARRTLLWRAPPSASSCSRPPWSPSPSSCPPSSRRCSVKMDENINKLITYNFSDDFLQPNSGWK